jgi:sugar lactone lactonase YvrE
VSLAYPTNQKDRFVALSWLDLIAFDWDNPDNVKVVANFDECKRTQANDGRADKNGRLWFGTLGTVEADEFIVDPGKHLYGRIR